MYVMVYDTECNGLDTKDGYTMELAWGVYNVCPERDIWRLTKSHAHLLKWSHDYLVDEKAFAVTQLASDFCEIHGTPVRQVFNKFLSDLMDCDFIAGQNIIQFDIPMMVSNLNRANLDSKLLREIPAIDTYYDLNLSPNMKAKSLSYFALDHGYVNFGAHQAMNDVFACAHILSKYSITTTATIAETPLIEVITTNQYANKERKNLLYSLGFKWNGDTKTYNKITRKFFLPTLEDKLDGLTVRQIYPIVIDTQVELPF